VNFEIVNSQALDISHTQRPNQRWAQARRHASETTAATTALASSKSAIAPDPIAWINIFPIAVASVGPAMTVRPVAFATKLIEQLIPRSPADNMDHAKPPAQ
jgi:hypothetical protein